MPQRRTTIDAIRGFCLVNIFVNHIHNGYLTRLSPSWVGFSDSADLFVLLSGISTALAAREMAHRPLGHSVALHWRRAARLYAFDLIVILASFSLLAAILGLRGVEGVHAPETGLMRDHGAARLLWHALCLGQTVGYSFVLRLHIALTLLAPFLLRLAACRPWAPLPPAILLWVLAGQFDWVIPNSLSGEPIHLTILPWTLLFTIGIVIGQGLNRGVVPPRNRPLTVLAVVCLAAYPILVLCLVHTWPAAHDWATTTRFDEFWLGASKTYQSPLRLLHVLALAYVGMALPDAPLIRFFHTVPPDHALVRLGRRSLPVFTAGAIAAVVVTEMLDLAAAPLAGAWPALLALEAAAIALFVGLALRFDRRARGVGPRGTLTPAPRDGLREAAAPAALAPVRA